jgi:hypothetical protein
MKVLLASHSICHISHLWAGDHVLFQVISCFPLFIIVTDNMLELLKWSIHVEIIFLVNNHVKLLLQCY